MGISAPDMVNVPSSDKVHVISAWIVPIEKTQRIISVKTFFIVEKNKKGADLPKSSSYPTGTAKHRNADK